MDRLRILFVLLIVCFSCNTMAQKNKKVQKKDSVKVASVVESKMDSLTSTKNEIDSLKNIIAQLRKEKQGQDSVNNKLKERLLFADSCFLRVSNDCFRRKYDKVRVDEAIANFGRMYSLQLQKSFAPLKSLLENYGGYYKEISDLLVQIENDKKMGNPFTGEQEKLANKAKLKSTVYYKKVYSANWTIMYLNDVIDKAIARLNAFDPKQKTIKLTDLLK